MTDEKKLIRVMWDRYNGHYNNANRFSEEETEMAYRVLSDLQLTIENMPEASEWILCSERLPEDDRTKLVTYDGVVEGGYYSNGQWWCICDGVELEVREDVVAWMPLPEPYKPIK